VSPARSPTHTISGMAAPDSVHVPLADEREFGSADWEKATAQVLRKMRRLDESAPDADVWTSLARQTLDGLTVTPLGVPGPNAPTNGTPGSAPFVRGARSESSAADDAFVGWDVRAWFVDPDPDRTGKDVLTDLENGVNSLWLGVGPGSIEVDALPRVLEQVFVDLAPVVLDAPEIPVAAAEALDRVYVDKAVEPAPGTNFGADPIGALVRGFGETDLAVAAAVATLAQARGVAGIVVDATAVHDQGASDVQELAYSIAAGTAYLRLLVDAGFTVDEAADQIDFRYAATDEQFPTIAKFRAARQLWARVAELSGLDLDKLDQRSVQRQHAVTSSPMMSKYDPWVNMLRTTVAAFAAGVGGAEAVTVQPFDSPLGMPDALGRRNARNTSSLLISESHVARVTDPAGGSYAVERLTHELCEAAWAEFQRIEQSGGIGAALEDRSLQGRIDQVVAVREAEIARRRRPLTGVTEFPNLGETLPSREEDPLADVVRRYGASFEALRDVPATSPVFLATMGTIAAHTARATFASNLFAAGGIAVEAAGATAGVDDVLKAYAGQPVVCLAGADSIYAEWGDDLIARLRDAGATWIIIAGKISTSSISEELVDDSCAMGVDALAFLHRTREKLA
jgi:methylmalonyl-CoA mutase